MSAASLEVLEAVVEDSVVRSNPNGRAVVDEIDTSPNGTAVYVEGNIQHDAPPRRLNEMMLEQGYAYLDWAMNGVPGDNRAIFQYVSVGTDD